MEHTVKVWDVEHRVVVNQHSKSVWIAVGTYHGERVETKGRTETQALAQWREAARYKGG